jgi:hypothetical protein
MRSSDTLTADLFTQALPRAAAVKPVDADGFVIGWDFAHYRLTPPAAQLAEGQPVRQGWLAGAAVFGARTLKPTPQARAWLQLRLGAWQRGCAFESVQVTPHFLGQIDVPVCPVTRLTLGSARGTGNDAVVERVGSGAGYAAGNLATMSARAVQAKAALTWRDALTVVHRLEVSGLDTLDGLAPAQWTRLAVLMSFVTPLPHAAAAVLPLRVLPPNRLRLLNAVQALQAVVTLAFTQTQAVPRLRELMKHLPAHAKHDFQVFMLTLQARRLGAGSQVAGTELRHALEDAWADAALNRRWQRFALQLDEALCEQLVRLAARLGLGGKAWQWLPRATATEGWALPQAGQAGPQPGWARGKPPVKTHSAGPTMAACKPSTSTCSSSVPASPVPR